MDTSALPNPNPPSDLSLQTRDSLLSRLKGADNQAQWREFFDRYWRLIYNFARKAGLVDADAQDIVQEVMLSVSKSLPDYQRVQGGSFKGWLLTIVRRRLADHWRERYRRDQATVPLEEAPSHLAGDGMDDAGLERLWQQEWESRLLEAASARAQHRVGARNYLIFDMLARQEMPLRDVCRSLGVNAAQAYLAKHRVGKIMREEISRLRSGLS